MHQYSSRLFCSGEPVKAMRLFVAEKVREREARRGEGEGRELMERKRIKRRRKKGIVNKRIAEM